MENLDLANRKKMIYRSGPMFSAVLSLIFLCMSPAIILTQNENKNIKFVLPESYKVQGIIMAITVPIALAIVSITCGFLGMGFQKSSLLIVYQIILFGTFLAFLIQGSISIHITTETSDCHKVEILNEAENCANFAVGQLCTTNCPCNWNPYNRKPASVVVTDDYTAINFGHCSASKGDNPCSPFAGTTDMERLLNPYYKFHQMESDYNCAGMCEKAPYFLFSDTSNDGLPVQSCSGPVLNQLYNENVMMGIIFLVESFLILPLSIYLFIPFAYYFRKKHDLELKYEDLQVLIMCHYYRCGPLNEMLMKARDEKETRKRLLERMA